MAVDKKISQLTSLAQVDVAASTDVLPIVDTSATETKKITVSALVGAGATAGLTNVDINSGTIDGTTIGASSASTGAFTTLSASGVATFSAGTAALPSLTTTGDTNTGVFFPAADTVGVTTGGSERLRVDSSGNVGIGTTSPGYRLDTQTATSITQARFSNSATGGATITSTGASQAIWAGGTEFNGTAFVARATTSSQIRTDGGLVTFFTNDSLTSGNTFTPTERMRIDSSGNVGIGGTAQASNKTNITGTFPASGAASIGCNVNGTIPSGATSFGFSYQSNTSVENASFTLANWAHFAAYQGTKGASATVTNQFGVYVDSGLTGATNNFGFYSNIASGSNRWNFYAAGTASNYFAGNVYFGATTGTAPTLYYSTDSSGGYFTKNSNSTGATTAYDFLINGTRVGSITTSGSATAYNTSSDYRLKENVQPMTNALQKIAALKPCTYTWKSSGEAGEGFIAHELAEVFPQAVTGEKDAVDANGKISPQGVDTSFLVATLAAAIQELKAENDALKARVEALEAK